MIGLGVGIDYALFIVTRHRDQLRGRDGGPRVDRARDRDRGRRRRLRRQHGDHRAAARCCSPASRSSRTLGYTAAIVVLVAVLAAITLLPACSACSAARINALRLPGLQDPPRRARRTAGSAGRGWSPTARGRRWSRRRHPRRARGAAAHLHLGQTDVGALPTDTTARQAYDRMRQGFGAGSTGRCWSPSTSASRRSPTRSSSTRSTSSSSSSSSRTAAAAAIAAGWRRRAGAGRRRSSQAQSADVDAGSSSSSRSSASRPSSPRPTRACSSCATDLQKTAGVKSVTPAAASTSTARAAVYTLIADDRAVLATRPRTSSTRCATRDPQGHQGPGHDRRRRRHDRRLHRPRRRRSPTSCRW